MINLSQNLTAFLGYIFSLKWCNLLRNLCLKSFSTYINLPNAIKIYKDLHTIETQLLIKNENKHKAGIYCIFNIVNGKFYIGSAINNRINTRFRNHCIHGTGNKYQNH